MKKYLLGLLMALASIPAFAGDIDYIARQGADTIVVHASIPCPAPIRAVATQHGAPLDAKFLAATATVDGQKYNGCWSRVGDVVFVVYEDGDFGVISHAMFKPLQNI
jgi:nickel-dependent lactate racemase